MQEVKNSYEYDVALSYASEDRPYVETLANSLRSQGLKVFYDEYERADLWGKNLYSHLAAIYEDKARYCIMFLSQHYAAKVLPKHERDAAQARALREQDEYILPIRLDKTPIPGILSTIAYLNWHETTPEDITQLFLQKLRKKSAHDEPSLSPKTSISQKQQDMQQIAPESNRPSHLLLPQPLDSARYPEHFQPFVLAGTPVTRKQWGTSLIYGLAFRADKYYVASSHADGTITFWNLMETDPDGITFTGHGLHTYSVTFSTDGAILFSSGADKTIGIWYVSSLLRIHTLRQRGDLFTLACSANRRVLACGCDKTIKVWHLPEDDLHYYTVRKARTFSGHIDWIACIALSPDGNILASGSGDTTIKLWDVATGKERRTLSGHTDTVYALALSPDGHMLASGSYDRTIKLWNLDTGEELRTLFGHTNSIRSLTFNRSRRELISGGDDMTIMIWDPVTGEVLQKIPNQTSINALALSYDGRVLVSGGHDGRVWVWQRA